MPTVFKIKEPVISEKERKSEARDYASMSLIAALASCFILFMCMIFTIIMLGSLAPEKPWGTGAFDLFGTVVSFPLSGFAVVSAVIAFPKGQSKVMAVVGGIIGAHVFLAMSQRLVTVFLGGV